MKIPMVPFGYRSPADELEAMHRQYEMAYEPFLESRDDKIRELERRIRELEQERILKVVGKPLD